MRIALAAALVLVAIAAEARETSPSPPSSIARAEQAPNPDPWRQKELLGDALGRWLGVRNGKLDVFEDRLSNEPGYPIVSGTIRKDAAEIQLRWRADE
ncbi:MAG: hypothetical protein KGJ78_10475 [Alphaproteobacteria bacterium]|nr:hypothetical protein [Alphaproteobacteria bacterium]